MDIYLASDGGVVKVPHSLSDYDSLEGVYADVSAATGIVSGNVLLFTEDGRELRQEVLEELWERGGHAGASLPRSQAVYLFNRETFFSEPERWANELREELVLPPPLDFHSPAHSFEVAFDHLCHLQSLFSVQARSLRIAYANLAFHLEPILEAFREFVGRADGQLDQHERLLQGYEVDMAMLPKVVVHESLFRRRDKDGEDRKKTLVDWIHTKKMEQVRDWCQTAHNDYVNRYNAVSHEIEDLALQSEEDRQAAEDRILAVEAEFDNTLAAIEAARHQLHDLLPSDQKTARSLDQAMRQDLATITQLKNEFTHDLHVHLRNIATLQVRITKFTRPMTDLDTDLRQKNAFPHLERLHNLPFAYAANVVEVVHRKEFATALVAWTTRIGKAVNEYLASEVKRRQQHKVDNQLPWEIPALNESQAPRVEVNVGGGAEALAAVGLSRKDIGDLFKWAKDLQEDPDFMAIDPEHSPVSGLAAQIDTLLTKLDCLTGELETSLEKAVVSASNGEQTSEQLRSANAEYEQRIADMESAHQARLRELEDRYEQRVDSLQKRQAELQEELVRLRTDLGEEVSIRQHVAGELEDKTREWEEQHEFLVVLQADITQEKDRATDLGVRLQEALLDVDGMRSAEQTLVIQVREMQEDRTRLITDLGEAQLAAQNCGSELAGTKAELEITAAQLVQAQLDRDQALRNQSAEADRVMRDRIAEADGDRAVLEHQNLTLTKEIDELRRDATEKLEHAKNDAVRREDGLKAELSFTKAQLREVQRRETMLSDELAMAKDTSAALVQKETHSTNLTRDAVVLAGKYHDACQRLMTAISASTTISGSLSLPVRAKSPPTAAPTASELKDNSVLVRSLETASAFELDAFGDAVLRTINLARKLSKSCKQYRESGRGKITISSFGRGDLVLFLPTRNAAVKAWAAFNISAPHHFLHVTDDIQRQLVGKDYYLARITSTDEAVVNGDSPETNPYGLAEGLRYYSHHVEEWSPGLPSRSARRAASGPGPSGIPPLAEPTPSRARATSSFYPAPPRLERQGSAQSAPPPSPPNRLSPTATPQIQRGMSAQGSSPAPRAPSPLTMSRTHSPVQLPAGAGSGRTPASPIPRRLSARSPPTQPLRSILAKSPPPPPTSPTSPVAVLERPREYTHRHRPSLSSTASPPIDGFAPSSGGRPASVASSASSHPRGLSIPTPTAKAAPAAPVATSSTTGSPSSFDSRRAGVAMGGIPRKASLASLKGKGDDLFKPSPLGGNSSSADPEGSGAGTAPGTSLGAASGFLSGLSLTRKRQSGGSNLAPSAVDMLKRIDGSG